MTDLTITVASVKAGANAVVKNGSAGAALTQGQAVYLDAATDTYKVSDANLAGAESVDGITLNAASAGQPVAVLASGDLVAGATLVPGTTYVLSATAGMIAPQSDLTTGDVVAIIGVATSTTVLAVHPRNTGVTL